MVLEACSSSKIQECSGQNIEKDVRERDRISELPDAILNLILSLLTTRDSVGTSTLSKRWRNLWTSVPVIEINFYKELQRRPGGFIDLHFKNWFVNFVDRVIHNYEICWIQKFCLGYYSADDLSHVRECIELVTRLADLKELDLTFYGDQRVKLPSSTFTCKKLVILKLNGENIELTLTSTVCLPSLKGLHLESMKTLDVDSVKKFLTGCPVLEELHLRYCCPDRSLMKPLYVQSSSLKSFTFYSTDNNYFGPILKMVIDACNLERLDLMVDRNTQVDVINNSSMSSMVTVRLSVRNPCFQSTGANDYKINLTELLMKMSCTKYLYLSVTAMKSLQHQGWDYLPMFKNLIHLEVDTFCCSCPILPWLLESTPNLTSFALFKIELEKCPGPHWKSSTHKCLMSYLEKISLRRFRGYEYELEMVSYFLENAPALKKMSITFEYLKPEVVSNLNVKLLKLPKASTTCEIYIRNFLCI